VAPEAVWQVYSNVKFGMAAPYQSAEIWAVDFQEIIKIVATRCQI